MVEEKKGHVGGAAQLEGDLLTSPNHHLSLLRAELHDSSRHLSSQLSSPPSSPSTAPPDSSEFPNGHLSDIGQQSRLRNGLLESDPSKIETWSLEEIRQEYGKLRIENQELRMELRKAPPIAELQHAKDALSALKGDRKRLKAEKFELLNQMKELYATLEDKEKELRDFIRNYEQRMRESEATQLRLVTERDEAERDRWTILRHARDEAERGISLATQLNLRETQVQQLQEELHEAKRHLSQYGIYSEPDRSAASSTNAATSHYSIVSPHASNYAALGDSRSSQSADSGVRLGSNRDSAGNHTAVGPSTGGNLSDSPNEGVSLDLGDGSGGDDSMSVISTATLPQLFGNSRESPAPITFASLTRSLDANNLSRSAEQLLQAEAEARRKGSRRNGAESLSRGSSTGAKGAWGSISRVFARNKQRRTLDSSFYDSVSNSAAAAQRSSWSPQGSTSQSPNTEQESYGDKLRALEEAATLPMELWRASMVQAWVEISLGMPQYGSRCGDNVKSGKLLLELTDGDLQSELGIAHPLHRKKLRLAIEEHRNPALVRFPCIVELSHIWVSSEWLPDIGLPQYAETFAGGLVDARLLEHLSKKDLEKYLGVTRKFHLAAIAHGVHLLRMVAYDRQHLAERRRQCEADPLVWTNHHFLQWARSIDLNEYSENLKGSGVHGAFAVLEPTFSGDTLASAMGIPPSKQIIRRHLAAELDAILIPARSKITSNYRVTRPRYSTLEKQRGDSLGRSVAPPSSAIANEHFRRSTDDTKRRTSLRGSLSRALGLKVKNDVRGQEKGHVGDLRGSRMSPPPVPPHPPGKPRHGYASESMNGDTPPQGTPSHYASQYSGRLHSGGVSAGMKSSVSNSHQETPERHSRSSCHSNSEDTSEGNSSSLQTPLQPPPPPIGTSEATKHPAPLKHRRTTSVGDTDAILAHVPVHTPV